MKKQIQKKQGLHNITLNLIGLLLLALANPGHSTVAKPPSSLLSSNAKRMAVVIGANNGGEGREKLKYAHSDARSFADVLLELGGVDKSDVHLILEPSPASLREELDKTKKLLAGHKGKYRRTEIILYYSGHADETGLLLKKGKFSYTELKNSFRNLEADVKIAVLDACASGAFTRLKGGVKKPSFLMDESVDMQGYAILTSNSEDEPAQESERIKGSYFTNSLVTGLRGAADLTGDNRVTLNEAYQYAFHQTLAHTEETQAGAQHAGYDIQLKGSGEVVMSELNPNSAVIQFNKSIEGKITMRDSAGNLAIELVKNKSRAMELGLAPGLYRILLDNPSGPKMAKLRLVEGKAAKISESNFKKISNKEAYALRGKGKKSENGIREEDLVYDTIPVSFAMLPSISKKNGELVLQPTYHLYSFNLFFGGYSKLNGIGIGVIGEWAYEDVYGAQMSGLLNFVSDSLKGGQGSGLANYAKHVRGGQGAGLANIALDVKGGQGSGFLNVSGNLEGGQGTGFLNVALDVEGAQGSGFVNIAKNVKGVQGTGFMNISRDMEGIQVAGFMNLARDLKGVQATSFINVANHVKGVQLGFINIANTVDGETIGFLNLNKKSKISPVIWMDEARNIYTSLKTGSGNFYGLLHLGINLDPDLDQYVLQGIGIGYGIDFGSLKWNTDVSSLKFYTINGLQEELTHTLYGPLNQLSRLKTGLALNRWSRFQPEVGLTVNVLYERRHDIIFQNYLNSYNIGDHDQVKIWPGFYAALSF